MSNSSADRALKSVVQCAARAKLMEEYGKCAAARILQVATTKEPNVFKVTDPETDHQVSVTILTKTARIR